MTTQILRQQVMQIANELKHTHGNDYSEQVYLAYLELINTCPDKINTLQIIIDAFCDTIDYDHKDKVIASLQKKMKELEATIKTQDSRIKYLEEENKSKDARIIKLEDEIKELKN